MNELSQEFQSLISISRCLRLPDFMSNTRSKSIELRSKTPIKQEIMRFTPSHMLKVSIIKVGL